MVRFPWWFKWCYWISWEWCPFVRFPPILNSSWFLPLPRICWPISVDQPAAAAHLTENLNVAFELYQVRTGDGLKPLARNGIAAEGTREAVGNEIRQTIDLCRSEKGQVMRNNAEQFKLKFAKAWDDDGIARQEIRKVLHKYTSTSALPWSNRSEFLNQCSWSLWRILRDENASMKIRSDCSLIARETLDGTKPPWGSPQFLATHRNSCSRLALWPLDFRDYRSFDLEKRHSP